MTSPLDKLAFNATQAARVGWFFGQKLLAARLGRPVRLPEALRGRSMLDRQRLLADLRSLLEQDWRNIEAGYYALPTDRFGKPFEEIRRALDFFADLSAVERRRHGGYKERVLSDPSPGRYPAYYLQKFHFQTDGYLSDASAERYDHQVEVLFGGGAAAMRRQALVPLKHTLAGAGARGGARLLDVGCGTGRFLREASTCRRITFPSPGASSPPGPALGLWRAKPRRCPSPPRNLMSSPVYICSTNCRRAFAARPWRRSGECCGLAAL
jgi:hypothetical protein